MSFFKTRIILGKLVSKLDTTKVIELVYPNPINIIS